MKKDTLARNDIRSRLIKNSTIDLTARLSESDLFDAKDPITTAVPMINVALSGTVDGGLTPGLTMIAGASRNFKSGFTLLMVSSFLQKYPDGAVLFYDSEFGTPEDYFKSFNIDFSAVIHCPITDIEELKFDVVKQLSDIAKGDRIMIVVDSIGNLASKKEVTDALDQKSTADMTRAKQLKSLFRMVVPHLTIKGVPMIVVNHTYKEMSLYPKDILSGGTASQYNPNNTWIVGRRQDKDKDKKLNGYDFVINVEKSRYVRERSQIPITVSFEDGINRWSGLLDIAVEGKYVVKTKPGSYAVVNRETGEVDTANEMKEDAISENGELWQKMLAETDFPAYIESRFKLPSTGILG